MTVPPDAGGPLPRLCFITDPDRTGGRPLAKVVELVCKGGCRMIQVRAPGLHDRDFYLLARQLTHIAKSFGALTIINDRIDICHAVGAQGVHLGAGDLPLRVARPLLGPEKLLGYSAHTLKELRKAESEGADYVTFSPLFELSHKPMTQEPWGVAGYHEAMRHVQIPVFGLGGIREAEVGALIAQVDVHRRTHLAVVSLLSEAENISGTTEGMLRQLHPEWPQDEPPPGEARYTFELSEIEEIEAVPELDAPGGEDEQP